MTFSGVFPAANVSPVFKSTSPGTLLSQSPQMFRTCLFSDRPGFVFSAAAVLHHCGTLFALLSWARLGASCIYQTRITYATAAHSFHCSNGRPRHKTCSARCVLGNCKTKHCMVGNQCIDHDAVHHCIALGMHMCVHLFLPGDQCALVNRSVPQVAKISVEVLFRERLADS